MNDAHSNNRDAVDTFSDVLAIQRDYCITIGSALDSARTGIIYIDQSGRSIV